MKSALVLVILLALMIVVPAAPAQEAGKSLVSAYRFGDPGNFDPQRIDPEQAVSADAIQIASIMCEGLFSFDPDLNRIPVLVKETEERKITENEDGTSITFPLRTDAKFGSERVMTAEDVTYSIERLMSMNATPTAKFLNEHSVSIQALSDDTVMFNLDTPFLRDALELSLALPGAYILNSDIVNARPDDFWLVPGMCVGSYYVDQYKPNEMLGLVRNDDYYGPLSDVQVWEFLDGYRTPQDQCDLFETGQVDLAYVDEETYNSPDCAPDFERGVYSLPEYGDFVAQLRERGASLDEENAALLEWVYPGPVYLLVTPEGQSKLQQPAYADSWACVCRFIPFLC